MNSINKTAKMAGLIYLMMTPLGFFGMIYVPSILIVSGDAIATVNNIMTNEFLFRLSIVITLIVQICHIFIVLLLYKVLKPVNRDHAVLMVIFMLVAIPIAMLNEVNNFAVLLLLSNGVGYLQVFTTDQLQALATLFLDFHESGISNIAAMFWGLWLFPMGYLVFKSGYIPKFLGVLLMIGCFGYLIDSVIFSLFPDSNVIIGIFTWWGEILFPLWLLIKGVKDQQPAKRETI